MLQEAVLLLTAQRCKPLGWAKRIPGLNQAIEKSN